MASERWFFLESGSCLYCQVDKWRYREEGGARLVEMHVRWHTPCNACREFKGQLQGPGSFFYLLGPEDWAPCRLGSQYLNPFESSPWPYRCKFVVGQGRWQHLYFLQHLFSLCVHGHTCGGQRITFRSLFSSSALWLLGIDWIQIFRLGGMCLCPLSHLISAKMAFLSMKCDEIIKGRSGDTQSREGEM